MILNGLLNQGLWHMLNASSKQAGLENFIWGKPDMSAGDLCARLHYKLDILCLDLD